MNNPWTSPTPPSPEAMDDLPRDPKAGRKFPIHFLGWKWTGAKFISLWRVERNYTGPRRPKWIRLDHSQTPNGLLEQAVTKMHRREMWEAWCLPNLDIAVGLTTWTLCPVPGLGKTLRQIVLDGADSDAEYRRRKSLIDWHRWQFRRENCMRLDVDVGPAPENPYDNA